MNKLDLCRQSWHDHPKILQTCIEKVQAKTILEIGAGPNPSISPETISKYNIQYHLNDYSAEELSKGNNEYLKIPGNFAELEGIGKYDLICSRMLLEHVNDPKALHQKIYDHLNPGGIAVHFFATLYALPTLLNLILPESFSSSLLKWGQGRDEEVHGKFPAKYKWCKGPMKGFAKRFEKMDFEVLEHRGYVGHDYLVNRKGLHTLEKCYSKLLLKLNSPLLCSNSILVLQKSSRKLHG